MPQKKLKPTLLEALADKHTDWIKMTKSLDSPGKISQDTANEIVQEMYIRLYKYVDNMDKIMYGMYINTMFVYITLRNLYYNHLKDKKKVYYTNELHFYEDEVPVIDYEYENQKTILEDEILTEIKSWHHYDEKLFKIINYDGISMRQLSRDTGISLSSIFNSNKKAKEIIRVKFDEQYKKLKG